MYKIIKPSNFIEGLVITLTIIIIVFLILFSINPNLIRNSIDISNEKKIYSIIILTTIDVILIFYVGIKKYTEKNIKERGIEITAIVINIKRNMFFKFPTFDKNDSIYPYIIKYKFTYLNRDYISTSNYYWKMPKWNINDNINILVIKDKPNLNLIK